MKYRQLGRTGVKVSEVGFGCWAIGGTSYGPTQDDQSLEALETAWSHGVNFYDTADTYGHGHSEKLLAEFLKGKPRGQVMVATKVGWDFYHGGSRKNFAPDYIRFACDESLRRLEIDCIDLYQLHNPSREEIQNGRIVGVLEEMRKKGKVRFIGISIHAEGEALAAMEDDRVDTLQVVFNLIDQRMADKVFPSAKEKGIGILAREPLACGLLTDKYRTDHEFARDDHRRRWSQEKLALDLQKIEHLKSILSTQRLSLARAALEYVIDFDAVSTVIPGAKTRAQVLENLLATEDPRLRIEEASRLRELYQREEIFWKGLFRE